VSITELYKQLLETSVWELIAVLTSLLYVYFATKGRRLCWLFALISTTLSTFIFMKVQLYLESALQIFYILMAVYGYFTWRKSNNENQKIRTWTVRKHLLNIGISLIVMLVFGYLFSTRTDQESPYIDAFTTVFSLAATFMVAYRILENWIYWIVIDTVSIYLYQTKELYLSAVLMLLFTLLAVKGLYTWENAYKTQMT
jgi:nicotinamide mononucleotide transporter